MGRLFVFRGAAEGTGGGEGRGCGTVNLKAIDIHTHIHTGDRARQKTEGIRDGAKTFGTGLMDIGLDERAALYRDQQMMAVIFDVDYESASGLRSSNDDVAAAVARYPDLFIGFGTVDPWKGEAAVREIRRSIGDLGLKGLKFQQITQKFDPSDRHFYPLYETIAELGVPVIFHMGTTAIGAGSPGGRGYRLEYGRPILIDGVAADFPKLTIIGAHPGWPWHDELLAVARHKGNVYIDLSGWAPKYFPPSVVQYANTLLQDKVLFGTDFPMLTPDRWLKEFEELPFKPEVRQKILLENARRLLKLG